MRWPRWEDRSRAVPGGVIAIIPPEAALFHVFYTLDGCLRFNVTDLDALAEFLASERAPPGSMDLSELDGFMAGLIAGPVAVPPDGWLEAVWDDEVPAFANAAERAAVLGAIGARYREIATGLEADPPSYTPVFWEDVAGAIITEDWAAGFMQAVALYPRAWSPVLSSDEGAALLIPIAAIAGLALPAEAGGDLDIPDAMLDRITRQADRLLPDCVTGLRGFWRGKGVVPASWPESSDGARQH